MCVGETTAHGAKRPHAKNFLFDAFSLLPIGVRQNLEGMGKAIAHGAKRLHTREDNIMSIVNEWIPYPIYVAVCYLCDKLPYVRFYGFGIILLVLTKCSIYFHGIYFEKICVSLFNHSCYIIIENDLVVFS